jgi:hypothetical protein
VLGHGRLGQMGLARESGWVGWIGLVWVEPSSSAQKDKMVFLILEFISNAKTIPEKCRNFLKARKIPRKFQKFQEFPQIDWNMNSPNKVFRAHEKDFRAF